jgi:hypothetical protein
VTNLEAEELDATAVAIQRMLDDGAPTHLPVRSRRSPWRDFGVADQASGAERVAQRRLTRRVFRLYCVACGRASEMSTAPARVGRCLHCGGTMLLEVAPD